MASTNKFPSGLNNWVDSDKPTRLDFVGDNEILDENALWKADYDADGAVAEAGGIAGFAMDKNSYDEDGSVAAAGGIAAAIAAKGDAINVYTHSKTGTVHSVVLANGGDNIKFTAAADFEPGDSLLINGAAVAVLDSDGNPVDCPFRYGDVVLMLRAENEARVLAPLANKAAAYPAAAAILNGGLVVTSPAPNTPGYAVMFDMPVGYVPANTLDLNGDTVQVAGLDGQAMELAAAAGSPVELVRRGNRVYPGGTSSAAMPLAGGTFTGNVAVPGGTDYTAGRVRNIFLNTSATWPAGAQDGDILLVYT